jgi:hypothetical protein
MIATDTPLRVEYALEREDYWQFNRYVHERSPKFRLSRFVQRYLFFGLSLVLNLWALSAMMARSPFLFGVGLAISFAIAAVVGGLVYLVTWWCMRWQVMRLPSGSGSLTAPCALSIGPDGMAYRSVLGEGTLSWRAVEEIAEDRRHAYLLVDDPMAIVLPMRAFADAAEFRAFVAAAHGYWRQAVGAAPI